MEGEAHVRPVDPALDRWLSGQKQQTVNLPAHVAYGGSNPPLSTRRIGGEWRESSGQRTFLFVINGLSLAIAAARRE